MNDNQKMISISNDERTNPNKSKISWLKREGKAGGERVVWVAEEDSRWRGNAWDGFFSINDDNGSREKARSKVCEDGRRREVIVILALYFKSYDGVSKIVSKFVSPDLTL